MRASGSYVSFMDACKVWLSLGLLVGYHGEPKLNLFHNIPIVSIVVPFWGVPYRILNIYLVKPKKGTTMETIGKDYIGIILPQKVKGYLLYCYP